MSNTAESIKLLQSITVAIIVLVITIPHVSNTYNQNYVLDFCIEGSLDNAISFERLDFFACEIGFIDGEIDLDLYLAKDLSGDIQKARFDKAFSEYTKVDILVLNYQNYNNFVKGEDYGVSNIELLSLNINPDNNFMHRNIDYLYLYPDYYFLVFNWEYGEDDGTYDYPEQDFFYHIHLTYDVGAND
ncbi:MAG: hypothetical protein CXT75_01095 [Methanobacteriota archaeon]|jgi:hypothetical protein|nr:MAG: hypothetical protein CXT75_01095 [Euryarchaeota archaeon]